MRRLFLAGCFLLLAFLPGCMTTRRVEQNRVVNVGFDSGGNYCCTNQASENVRLWRGPWIVQPDRVRP